MCVSPSLTIVNHESAFTIGHGWLASANQVRSTLTASITYSVRHPTNSPSRPSSRHDHRSIQPHHLTWFAALSSRHRLVPTRLGSLCISTCIRLLHSDRTRTGKTNPGDQYSNTIPLSHPSSLHCLGHAQRICSFCLQRKIGRTTAAPFAAFIHPIDSIIASRLPSASACYLARHPYRLAPTIWQSLFGIGKSLQAANDQLIPPPTSCAASRLVGPHAVLLPC